VGDALTFDDAVSAIRRYSFLETDSEANLSLHRLVQAVIRDRLDEPGRQQWAEAAVNAVNKAFPNDSDDVRTWKECNRLLPHAIATTDLAEPLAVGLEAAAHLLNQIAVYALGRAEYSNARAAFERALKIYETAFGLDDPKVATVVSNLGSVLGLGLYTYIASLVLMPVYLVLTYLVLFLSGERRVRPYAAITAGFILLVLPLAAYLVAVPEVYTGFTARYGGANVDVLHNPGEMFIGDVMAKRWATYRSFFEWSFLFDHAETHVMSSTYTTGIFLKAMKVLIPVGAYHILRNRRSPFTVLLLAAFLAAPLAAKVSAGETLFIIAKSISSPGPPVAVLRGTVGDWPMKFSLDDSLAMLPGRNLSSAGPVMIEARISRRGQPLPASGDLQGSAGPYNPSEHAPLNVLIDRVVP